MDAAQLSLQSRLAAQPAESSMAGGVGAGESGNIVQGLDKMQPGALVSCIPGLKALNSALSAFQFAGLQGVAILGAAASGIGISNLSLLPALNKDNKAKGVFSAGK